MKNYYERNWKTGELAKMFDVNVQLLRHYDKEGLLVPEIRNPATNWRSYRYDQIYSLGMIRLLRCLDCSLDDIGEFMPGRDPEKTEDYLKRRMEEAKARYEKLFRMESVINDRFALIKSEMKYAESGQVFVYSEDEMYYIEIGGIEKDFIDNLLYLYPTLVFYEGEGTRFAVMIPHEKIGDFDKYSDRIKRIPPGDYLVGFHSGAYENIYETFARIEQAAEDLLEEGSAPGQTRLCLDIIDQLIEADKDSFVTKVMIPVISDADPES